MSRWFRHYTGMMRDEKLVSAAIRSKQTVERVVWIWGAILESAAEINDGGRYELDPGEAAYFLRCDEADVVGVVGALEALGRLNEGCVAQWAERQFESDASRDRQKRYRERQKQTLADNGDVTPPSRDAEVTLQENRDREQIQISGAKAPSSPEPEKSAPVAVDHLPCVSGEAFPIFEADVSEWSSAFPAVDVRQQLAAMRSWLNANQTRRKTRRGMRKFIVSWLDRRQNSGTAPPPRAASPPANRKPNAFDAYEAICRERGWKPDEPDFVPSPDSDDKRLPAERGEHTGAIVDLRQGADWHRGSGNH